ncbi:MAG: response regulator, partial [Polyangiaceae bacterium]
PASATSPATLRGTETILLVEDNDQVRMVARSILTQNGYRVIDARNAEEAIRQAKAYGDRIHLMITDVVMPQMMDPSSQSVSPTVVPR